MNDPVRTERVLYSGRVQGVGFRFTVQGIADRFPVTGYVKNLPDGNVELLVQGTTGELEAFLQAIAERFRGHIRGCDRHTIGSPETFHNFEIRH